MSVRSRLINSNTTADRIRLAWIEGACDWEISRRAGQHYELRPPEAAIDPSEDEVSINAVHAMRESFARSGFAPAALKLFDALMALVIGESRRQ